MSQPVNRPVLDLAIALAVSDARASLPRGLDRGAFLSAVYSDVSGACDTRPDAEAIAAAKRAEGK